MVKEDQPCGEMNTRKIELLIVSSMPKLPSLSCDYDCKESVLGTVHDKIASS